MLISTFNAVVGFFKGFLKSIEDAQMKRAEAAVKYWQDRWY
jgi:hypothetical protein